ncbi:65-kDa microtubule-associated protein 5 [Ananas comosus]|uniref:65-kDa microtubule-associated protein 5 n=1 Tax=Ananas comosus TaxID=4615 RepID=A0A199VLJ7_ANACO|nr:65-kDa microtubule-associated protein 5 [Ananas comosus]
MSRFQLPSPPRNEATSCGSMLQELQDLWDEIGETDLERDRMILQLEQECLNIYRKKVDQARKQKADLHQILAEGEAEVSLVISALGERESLMRLEKPKGSLKEQVAALKPLLEELRRKKEERIREFTDVQLQIVRICAEIAGDAHLESPATFKVDEGDLTIKRLGELKSQLHELQLDKNLRLKKVNALVESIHELCMVMSVELNKTLSEVHSCFSNSRNNHSKSISNDTLARLGGTVHALKQEKLLRLKKLQDLGSTLIELWNLMDTPVDEQKRFDHVTSLISATSDAVTCNGCLALDVIEQVGIEVDRLNVLKASKMKELVLKKQSELEEIYRSVHMDVESATDRQILINFIDSGKADLCELLGGMENRIEKAKEQASSRKEILEKVEKWKIASEEERWLDDYERDQNRYNTGRGVHKNLKRAEKARILVSKIPSMIENLSAKIRAWEQEKGIPFMYDKVRLLDTLEEYAALRQQKEEEKRRSREQKKLQEQQTAEQEALYGTKPSPMRQFPVKKPLGQSSNVNMAVGTPTGRRVSTPLSRHGFASSGKDKKEIGKGNAVIPVNYVALPKDILSP